MYTICEYCLMVIATDEIEHGVVMVESTWRSTGGVAIEAVVGKVD